MLHVEQRRLRVADGWGLNPPVSGDPLMNVPPPPGAEEDFADKNGLRSKDHVTRGRCDKH